MGMLGHWGSEFSEGDGIQISLYHKCPGGGYAKCTGATWASSAEEWCGGTSLSLRAGNS